jgi:queuosine precursor transporter
MIDAAIYIIAVLAANYTAAWFIPLPIFGLVSVGTLFFGITFTQRDRVHRHGRRAVYLMIAVAAALNVLESALLDVPWRIILASFLAIILAETADTEVYQRLIRRPWLQRVAGSNAISIPIDSSLFTFVAFGGVFPLMTLVQIIFGDVVLKTVIGLLSAVRRLRGSVGPPLATEGQTSVAE